MKTIQSLILILYISTTGLSQSDPKIIFHNIENLVKLSIFSKDINLFKRDNYEYEFHGESKKEKVLGNFISKELIPFNFEKYRNNRNQIISTITENLKLKKYNVIFKHQKSNVITYYKENIFYGDYYIEITFPLEQSDNIKISFLHQIKKKNFIPEIKDSEVILNQKKIFNSRLIYSERKNGTYYNFTTNNQILTIYGSKLYLELNNNFNANKKSRLDFTNEIQNKYLELGFKNIFINRDSSLFTLKSTNYLNRTTYLEIYIPFDKNQVVETILIYEGIYKIKNYLNPNEPTSKKIDNSCFRKTYSPSEFKKTTLSILEYTGKGENVAGTDSLLIQITPHKEIWSKKILDANCDSHNLEEYLHWVSTHTSSIVDTFVVVTDKKVNQEYRRLHIEYEILSSEGGNIDWYESICNEELTQDILIKIIDGLYNYGYLDRIENISCKEYKEAYIKFQMEQNLPVGLYDYGTLEELGVKFPAGNNR